jgi:hypothetical protein
MAMPHFTAEASLHRSGRSYRTRRHGSQSSSDLVVPQDQCGQCTCDPGQCCSTLGKGFCACKRCPPPSVVDPELLSR